MLCSIFNAPARIAGAAFAIVVFSAPARADDVRYVSINGSNANNCTLAAPCRTLKRGINQTPAGGELRVLSSGNYGGFGNIKKSMTITGDGHTVEIGNPITITKADAIVVLRGLVLYGGSSAENGILVNAAATVHVERCVVHGYPARGIRHGSPGNLFILDSVFRNNGNGGLSIFSTGVVTVTVDNSRFEDNQGDGMQLGNNGGSIDVAINRSIVANNFGAGIAVASGARVVVSRTVAAHNVGAGFSASTGVQLAIESSEAHDNNQGLLAEANTSTSISNSAFVNNVYGIFNNGGTVLTRGNNTASGNVNANVAGALTAIGGV